VASNQIDWLNQRAEWAGLKTAAMIKETREIATKPAGNGIFLLVV